MVRVAFKLFAASATTQEFGKKKRRQRKSWGCTGPVNVRGPGGRAVYRRSWTVCEWMEEGGGEGRRTGALSWRKEAEEESKGARLQEKGRARERQRQRKKVEC